MSTVFYLDMSSRKLSVWVAHATQTEGGGIVLRGALQIGRLPDLLKIGQLAHPLVVGSKAYTAQSSAGFTRADGPEPSHQIVGKLGFRPGGLRVLSHPEACWAFPAGTRVTAPESSIRSNRGQVDALREGAKFLAQFHPRCLVVTEGQSDRVSVWQVIPPEEGAEIPEFHPEHQSQKFTDAAMAEAMVRGLEPGRQMFLLALGLAASLAEERDFYWQSIETRGDFQSLAGIDDKRRWEIIKKGGGGAFRRRLDEGFVCRVVADNPTRSEFEVTLPSGEVVSEFFDLKANSAAGIEDLLLDVTENEDAKEIRQKRRIEMLRSRIKTAELHSGVSYRLIPALMTHYRSAEDWDYTPKSGLPPVESQSIEAILSDSGFEKVAEADILFLVAHDEEGSAQSILYLTWASFGRPAFGERRVPGWGTTVAPAPMYKALSKN